MTWWITDTSIGQRLKFVRRFRRLTQKELGLLMGYSEKTADVRIAQYEKNARTPNAETTAKLAEVLKVSPVVFSPTICASREDLLQSILLVRTMITRLWKLRSAIKSIISSVLIADMTSTGMTLMKSTTILMSWRRI